MTDNDFLLHVLSDGEWHNLDEILDRSLHERGCRLTVHSRASNLRHLGYTVENQTRRNEHGRTSSFYRLVLDRADAVSASTVNPLLSRPASAPSSTPSPNPHTHYPLLGEHADASTRLGDEDGVLTLFEEVA